MREDVLDQEAAQDDAAWRRKMDAAVSLGEELDAEEALADCIVEVFAAVCTPPAVSAVEPEADAGVEAEGTTRAVEGRCARCGGERPSYLGSCCRSCLDGMRDRNRKRQGFKGRVYRCSLCWTAGHNARTCAMREVAA